MELKEREDRFFAVGLLVASLLFACLLFYFSWSKLSFLFGLIGGFFLGVSILRLVESDWIVGLKAEREEHLRLRERIFDMRLKAERETLFQRLRELEAVIGGAKREPPLDVNAEWSWACDFAAKHVRRAFEEEADQERTVKILAELKQSGASQNAIATLRNLIGE